MNPATVLYLGQFVLKCLIDREGSMTVPRTPSGACDPPTLSRVFSCCMLSPLMTIHGVTQPCTSGCQRGHLACFHFVAVRNCTHELSSARLASQAVSGPLHRDSATRRFIDQSDQVTWCFVIYLITLTKSLTRGTLREEGVTVALRGPWVLKGHRPSLWGRHSGRSRGHQ